MRYAFEINGIFVNPELPENFDFTPHEERDDEMNWWWDKPYINIDELSQESWIEHYHRLKDEFNWSNEQIGTQADWENNLKENRESWLKKWHTGFRYQVRCLDGGAWDRSTNYGMYTTFDEALSIAKLLNQSNETN